VKWNDEETAVQALFDEICFFGMTFRIRTTRRVAYPSADLRMIEFYK